MNRPSHNPGGTDATTATVVIRPLLPLVAHGDARAISQCIQRYGGLVWSLARRLTTTRADAEDAVQEIFVDLWRAAARFDAARGSEVTFVGTIARHRLIDRLRGDRARLRAVSSSASYAATQTGTVQPGPELELDAQRAAGALQELPRDHAEAIALSVVHGLSHSEIAERLNLPLGTVKSAVRRGLLRVRERLEATTNTLRTRGERS